MAYYSIYKIIKDIVRTIFGNKILKILLITLVCLVIYFIIFNNKVSAAVVYDDITLVDGNSYELEFPDWFNYDDYAVCFYYSSYSAGSSNSATINFCITEKNSSYTLNSNNYITCTNAVAAYNYGGGLSSFGTKLSEIKSLTKQTNFSYTGYGYGVDLSRYGSSFSSYKFFNTLDIYKNNQIFQPAEEPIKYPEVSTSLSDLENLNFQVISINGWDYSNNDLWFLFYDRTYTDEDSFTNLYPTSQFLLNELSDYYIASLSSEADDNKVYWIPSDQLNTTFKAGGTYGFRFALRIMDGPAFSYQYITDEIQFTINQNLSSDIIASFNNNIKDQQEKENFTNIEDAINNQSQNQQNFYNNMFSEQFNENLADDTLTGATDSTDSIDNSQYIGLFSTVFGKFSDIINGDFSSIEEIHYPVPNTNKDIIIRSDLLSSKISNTFIYVIIQSLWMYIFGLYIFKFSNNLVRKIKDGSILNGYENNNEVITSTML